MLRPCLDDRQLDNHPTYRRRWVPKWTAREISGHPQTNSRCHVLRSLQSLCNTNGGSSASPRDSAGIKAYREGIQADFGCLRSALFPYRRNLLLAHSTSRHLAVQVADLPTDWELDSIPWSISHVGVVRSSADCSRTSQASWSLSYRGRECN